MLIDYFSNRLPRFQFFYQTIDLIKRYIRLQLDSLEHGEARIIFEKEISDYFNVKYCLTTSSFRMGLFHTLKSLNLQIGDEILLSSITIPDVLNAILILKLKPVFIDLSIDTHAMDPSLIEGSITSKTKVLLLTYLSGIVPDIAEIQLISTKHNLFVIEDFSQNFEATYKGQYMGTFGDVGIGSLSSGKILSSITGGIILTNKKELAVSISNEINKKISKPRKRVLSYYLKNCIVVNLATIRLIYIFLTHSVLQIFSKFTKNGILDFEHEPKHRDNIFYTFIPVRRTEFPSGFYTWLSDWQCKLASSLLKQMKAGTNQRRELARVLINSLSEDAKKLLPKNLLQIDSNSFYHFPIYCYGEKATLRKFLFERGIDNGSYGLNLNNKEECFRDFNCDLRNSYIIKYDTIFVPINEKYSENHMKHMALCLNQFVSITNLSFDYFQR